jgi:tRNA pseudouridine13 synthase
LKVVPEDFIVEEIGDKWDCAISDEKHFSEKGDFSNLDMEESREFIWCELEKYDIDSFRAMRECSSQIRRGVDAVGFAGTKDKRAWTSQRISIFRPDMDLLQRFSHPNIYLKKFKWAKRKIKMGFLQGNRFRVVLRDVEKNDARMVSSVIRKTKHFANYFGKQRFGSVRGNNAKIGKLIIKKKYKDAVWAILTETSPKEREETREARMRFAKERNCREALTYFPEFLRFERRLLEYLANNDKDYVGALRRVDKKNCLMFVHALQSLIFNEILEEALEAGVDFTKPGQQRIPLFGYKGHYDGGELGQIEEEVMARNGLTFEDFRLDELSYLSLKGDLRLALIPVDDLEVNVDDDEMFEGSKKIELSFRLPSGVYATTFLANFFDLEETKPKN